MSALGYAANMTLITVCVILFVRNFFVHRFVMRLLKAVREVGIEEINNDDFLTHRQRYKQLASVDYIDLVLVFWKPFRSFYAGKDLIEPLLHEHGRTSDSQDV